jgi:phosphoenolpyruvate carboxykinase (GTP)
MEKLLAVDPEEWRAEVPSIREHFAQFGDKLPEELRAEVDRLEQQLG